MRHLRLITNLTQRSKISSIKTGAKPLPLLSTWPNLCHAHAYTVEFRWFSNESLSPSITFFFSSVRVKIRHQFSQNTLFKQNKKDVKFCARLWKNRERCFFVLSRKWDKETAPDPHGTRTLVDSIPPEDFFPCPRSSQDEKMSFSDYFCCCCCCFICLFVLVYAERDRNSSYASFPALINWSCF